MKPRKSFRLMKKNNNKNTNSMGFSDIEYLNAPIVDIIIVQGSDLIPKGYHKIHTTVSRRRADLNNSAGGHYIYICIKKDLSKTITPVVAIAIIFPDRGEFVPYTFSLVRRKKDPIDLNTGTNGERVFLCF